MYRNHTIGLRQEAHNNLKLLAVRHGVRIGDAVAGLLALAASRPPEEVARALADADNREGELVPAGQEAAHVARAARGEDFE